MQTSNILIALIISFIVLITLICSLCKSKNRNKLHTQFILLDTLFCIHLFGLILQILFKNTNIPPVYFEYITYIGAMFMAVTFLMIAILFNDKSVDIKKYNWLYIIPGILLIFLWTNDLHHLFYIQYSTTFSSTVFGPLLYVYMAYSYTIVIIALTMIAISSIKKAGFFSGQTTLILIGIIIPVVGNMLGILNIIKGNVYIMPMTFTATAICFYIAIIKLKALSITPVTLKTIINTMSDAFVVISEDGTIADINKTFIDTFKDITIVKDKDNFFELIERTEIIDLDMVKEDILATKKKGGLITKEYHIQKGDFDKYFEIDCQPIKAKTGNEYIAYLILIRDITLAKRDMEIMTKNENLVILGELAGGVAHDINTPIAAIKSGLLMLNDMAVTDDQKMLLNNMNSCADKITNLVNSLRNQIRNIGSDEQTNISITNIINDIKLIIHNELIKSKIALNIDIKQDIELIGNSTKLSQVITNIIMNAIQAYEGKPGEINISVYKSDKNEAIIRVEDRAGGIPESVRPYIFKNILTTKGLSGTGFGLYLAYSVIKGAFGGEILFDTKTGEGTVFYIVIPLDI